MKPRFSILTLLGVTAYLAMMAAALVRPESAWLRVSELAWVAVIVYWIALAAQPAAKRGAIPARAALGGAMLYLLLASSLELNWLPHTVMFQWLTSQRFASEDSEADDYGATNVATSNPAQASEDLKALLGDVRIEYIEGMDSILLGNPDAARKVEAVQQWIDAEQDVTELLLLQTSLGLGVVTGMIAWSMGRKDSLPSPPPCDEAT